MLKPGYFWAFIENDEATIRPIHNSPIPRPIRPVFAITSFKVAFGAVGAHRRT
jgi:hypothetical protein